MLRNFVLWLYELNLNASNSFEFENYCLYVKAWIRVSETDVLCEYKSDRDKHKFYFGMKFVILLFNS